MIANYDNLAEDKWLVEDEAALDDPGQTLLSVPTELVPAIAQFIEAHRHQAGHQRSAEAVAAERRSTSAKRRRR